MNLKLFKRKGIQRLAVCPKCKRRGVNLYWQGHAQSVIMVYINGKPEREERELF